MSDILAKICADTRVHVDGCKSQTPLSEVMAQAKAASPVRGFAKALQATASKGQYGLIAEIKKASPSQGLIRENFDPVMLAKAYQQGGATCLSVLTDEPYFQGKDEYLTAARNAVNLPVLRKDFILDTYQLLEARAAGADAVLLIAECLDDCNLRKLHNETIELGMTPLVEFYEPENLTRVFDAGATLIGVNNRDLRTFEVDLQHTIRMREQIPDECVLVGESGIHSREDAERLESAGVDAILVGEHLMSQPDIGAAVRKLLGR